MGGDVHDRRYFLIHLLHEWPSGIDTPTFPPNADAIREVRTGFAANNMHSSGGVFRAAIKLEHARGVPPRGERECLGDDELRGGEDRKTKP